MATNDIVIDGTTYTGVPGIEVAKSGSGTAKYIDVTDTTAAAEDVASGKAFYSALGVLTQGSASGGGGGYTLLKSVEVDINFSSTTQALVATVSNVQGFETAQIIYVCIRDKAGKRKNHFYGTDNWIPNLNADAGSGSSVISAQKYRVTSTPIMEASTSSFGLWVHSIDTSGNVEIYARYSNQSSLTINGTFQIDVYAMSWPDGKNIFE